MSLPSVTSRRCVLEIFLAVRAAGDILVHAEQRHFRFFAQATVHSMSLLIAVRLVRCSRLA